MNREHGSFPVGSYERHQTEESTFSGTTSSGDCSSLEDFRESLKRVQVTQGGLEQYVRQKSRRANSISLELGKINLQETSASQVTAEVNRSSSSSHLIRRHTVAEVGDSHPHSILKIAGSESDKSPAKQVSFSDLDGLTAENPCAQVALGTMFEYGLGVEKDLTKAVKWYKEAAFNAIPNEKTFEFLESQILNGDTAAQNQLGNLYLTGGNYGPFLVNKDTQKALLLLKKAAKKGSAAANFSLGKVYADGADGVNSNYIRAADYFKKAKDLGHQEATEMEKAARKSLEICSKNTES